MNELMTIERFDENQETFLTGIIESKGGNLPVQIEVIKNVFEFTDFKAKAWKMVTDKMRKLDEHSEAYNSALRSGQNWGIAALYAQKRMGECTREMPQGIKGPKNNLIRGEDKTISKQKTLKAQGIDFRKVSEFERIANNPDVLEQVIESAKEHGEIPTKTAVINTIRFKEAKKRSEENDNKKIAKKVRETPKAVKKYFTALATYKDALAEAVEATKQGMFSAESKNIIITKHDGIKILMHKMEVHI